MLILGIRFQDINCTYFLNEKGSNLLLKRNESCLVVIDVQEKLIPSIADGRALLSRLDVLLDAAELMDVPVSATEHCPDRIGPTVASVSERIKNEAILPKVHFNAASEPRCQDYLFGLERKQPILCGVETHVCVLQTALGLKMQGYDPIIISDAVGSRKEHDRIIGLQRARDSGIRIATIEMVIFEWLERGDSDEFRRLLPSIKRLL